MFDKRDSLHSPVTDLEDDSRQSDTVMGDGKCMVGGCSCPSFVDPPGGFDCKRCGHAKSEHW